MREGRHRFREVYGSVSITYNNATLIKQCFDIYFLLLILNYF